MASAMVRKVAVRSPDLTQHGLRLHLDGIGHGIQRRMLLRDSAVMLHRPLFRQARLLFHAVAKHHQRGRHPADLVAPFLAGDGGVHFAGRHRRMATLIARIGRVIRRWTSRMPTPPTVTPSNGRPACKRWRSAASASRRAACKVVRLCRSPSS
ncbi:MAG TPA: hypothetical protein VMB34_04460 [Acetobacteraceae bacterium]|nr:hypothetical protein [Acetobacteraceae bacterium]